MADDLFCCANAQLHDKLRRRISELESINAGQAQRLSLIAWWCGAPEYKVREASASAQAQKTDREST